MRVALAADALYPFCVESRCGLVDGKGNWRVKPVYSRLDTSGDYWVGERRSGLVALLAGDGRTLIAPALREIGEFRDGLAPAQGTRGDDYGYIRPDGSWAISPRFRGARPFDGGVAQVVLPTGGESVSTTGFINKEGQPAFKGNFLLNSSSSSAVGLALVDVAVPGEEAREALIDRQGRYVVPPRAGQHIELGEDGSIIVSHAGGVRLVNARGRSVFELSGDEALIRSLSEGRALFEQPGRGVGLVATADGRVIVPPRRDWSWIGNFSEGLASVQVRRGPEETLSGFIDREGRLVIAANFASVGEFRGSVAPARIGEGGEGLIDRSGRWHLAPANGQYIHQLDDHPRLLASDSPSAARLRRVLVVQRESSDEVPPFAAEAAAAAVLPALPPVAETLLDGRRLASVHRHPCGILVALNAAGERIWPENPVGRCAALQLARNLDHDEGRLSAAARAAYQEEKRSEQRADAEWTAEVRQRDRYSGGVAGIVRRRLYPELAARDRRITDLIEQADWRQGDELLELGHGVHLKLPPGVRILLPAATASLQQQLAAIRAEPLPLPAGYQALQRDLAAGKIARPDYEKQEARWRALFPDTFAENKEEEAEAPPPGLGFALIGSIDERWQARIFLAETGALRLEESSLPNPDELIETLRRNGFWRNTGGLNTQVHGYSFYKWIQPPLLEKPGRLLSWAFYYSDLYSGPRAKSGRGAVINVLVPGRQTLLQLHGSWDGACSEGEAASYLPELMAVARGVSFAPGQGYDDYHSGDRRLQMRLDDLMTGGPPKALQEFNQLVQNYVVRVEEARRQELISLILSYLPELLSALAAIGGAVGYRSTRRAGKNDELDSEFNARQQRLGSRWY